VQRKPQFAGDAMAEPRIRAGIAKHKRIFGDSPFCLIAEGAIFKLVSAIPVKCSAVFAAGRLQFLMLL
ncbi:hypothetical protein NY536_28785, partial [Enterobacter hormaechei]|nr:hypothetical protein [Enterobacter hormaechei]